MIMDFSSNPEHYFKLTSVIFVFVIDKLGHLVLEYE